MGAHLGLTSRARREQVLHMARENRELEGIPMIWGGDFNEWSRTGVLDHLAPNMRFLPPKPSFPALRPLGALDRIAVSPELQPVAHGVFNDRPAHIASDHLPVWADLETA